MMHADDDDAHNVGDVAVGDVDPAELERLADLFDRLEPLDALRDIYGDRLVIP